MPKGIVQQDAEPWERQPRESPQAYGAFSAYRDMGPGRGLRAVGQKLGKSRALVERWSSAWGWVERARAWDSDAARKAMADADEEIASMVRRHLKAAIGIQEKAIKAIHMADPGGISVRDAAALLKLGLDTERLNRGEPTERTEGRTTVGGEISFRGIELGALSDDELEQLDAIASKVAGSA